MIALVHWLLINVGKFTRTSSKLQASELKICCRIEWILGCFWKELFSQRSWDVEITLTLFSFTNLFKFNFVALNEVIWLWNLAGGINLNYPGSFDHFGHLIRPLVVEISAQALMISRRRDSFVLLKWIKLGKCYLNSICFHPKILPSGLLILCG